MKRSIPWLLAILFAGLFAVSLVSRRSGENLPSTSKQTADPPPAPRPEEPPKPSRSQPDRPNDDTESAPPFQEARELRFDPNRPLREQIREELKKRYIGSPPRMTRAVGERLKEATPILFEILKDPDWGASGKWRAADLLLKHRVPGTKETLEGLLTDKKASHYMVSFLAEHGDRASAGKMIEIYDASNSMTQEAILRAVSFIGHPEGVALVDQALKKHADDYGALLTQAQEQKISTEDIVYYLEGKRAELEFYRKAIVASGSENAVVEAIPALYHDELYAREWGLHVLDRERPSTLALHLRAAMDIQKTRPMHQRSTYDLGFEKKLLTILSEVGGELTASEETYLREYGKPGCVLPKPSD